MIKNLINKNESISNKLSAGIVATDDEFKDKRCIDLIKSMGFKTISIPQSFPVKLHPGQMDRSVLYDYLIKEIVDRNIERIKYAISIGLEPMITFNSNVDSDNFEDTQAMYSTEQIAAIKKWVDYTVDALKDKPHLFMTWNEPDGNFWNRKRASIPNDGEASQEVKTSIDGWIDMDNYITNSVKAANSDNLVASLTFSISPNYSFNPLLKTIDYAKSKGILDKVDAVCYHPYLYPWHDNVPEPVIFMQTNLGLPMITNEFGFPFGDTSNHDKSVVTLANSIKLTLRQAILLDYLGYSQIGIYGFNDPTFTMLDETTNDLNGMGYAVKNLIQELDGYKLERFVNTPTLDNYVFLDYVAVYKSDGKPTKLVYWNAYNFGKSANYVIDGKSVNLKFTDNIQIKTI